jgi:hypothetical protein
VRGPLADALLLAGWLRSRLERPVRLRHEEAPATEAVAVDRADVSPSGPAEPESPSELLSRELDRLARDPIYEQATQACLDV